MTDDATLADFLDDEGAGSDSDSDSSTGSAADAEATADAESGAAADTAGTDSAGERVDPADATYAWGVAHTCSDCGDPVDRCWLDDGAAVCPACKQW